MESIKLKAIHKSNGDKMHRLYNTSSGEHFYMKDISEKKHLVSVGWRYESIGRNAQSTSNTPVYRLYNPNAYACNHNYTKSKSENDVLIGLGWKYEGIGWYGVK